MNFDDFKGHVYLIDDDPSISRSLSFMLTSCKYSIQTFDGPTSFLRDSIPFSPAVILLDMHMPDMLGTTLQQQLIAMDRQTPIIFISGESQPIEIIEAMKSGAADFLLKPFSMESLLTAIEKGLAQDRHLQALMVQGRDFQRRFDRLTEKEKEICRWMVRGLGNKKIAEINGSAPATVKLHRSRVLEKFGCKNLSELIAMSFDGNGKLYEFLGQSE